MNKSNEEPTKTIQGGPGRARRSKEELREVRRSKTESEGGGRSQEKPGGAREDPRRARRSQKKS